jgi:hypothetical protein
MRPNKASLWLSALLVLGGCPDPITPPPPPEAPKLSSVTVTCDPASIPATRPVQCTALAKDQYGERFDVSYTWTSSDESVAKVGSTGKVSTIKPGTATISASATAGSSTQQGQASVTVTPVQATLHTNAITTNETWREADNPHVVRGIIEVNGSSAPTLTLEAGVELRFEFDAELRVTNGVLRAPGTQESPIRLVANQSEPTTGYWRGVVFTTAGSASEFSYVTLSNCGRGVVVAEEACITIKNQAAPVLRNVTIRNSGGVGVWVNNDGSAFGAGSTMLSISGSADLTMLIGADQAGTLPTGGSFTDNAINGVDLSGGVSRSQTWPNLGIPYIVNDVIRVQGASNPTLTISAGTVFRFGPGYWFSVGDTAPGGLIVDGTAASPVLFTVNSANPQPGYWDGVHLRSQTSSTTRLSYTTIEYAGRGTGAAIGSGNLNVYGNKAGGGARPVINNVTVRKSADYGVQLLDGGAFGPGSSVLSVYDSGVYAITTQANYAGTLPMGGTISGNALNAVEISGGDVLTTQTWPKLEVHYEVNDLVNVGSASNPTLTLPAGTQLRFGVSGAMQIGKGQPGALIAAGTAAAPILFDALTRTPVKGSWRGLHFWQAGGSKLDHVTVTHAGAGGLIGTGNVNVYNEIGAFVTNSTFSESSGCGITRSDGSDTGSTAVTTDFTLPAYNNTFANNDGGAQCTN